MDVLLGSVAIPAALDILQGRQRDAPIAATMMVHGMTGVTVNVVEFETTDVDAIDW